MTDDDMPDHLRPIEPAAAVYKVTQELRRFTVGQYGLLLELQAFEETRTVHDGRRLANALLHVIERRDLSLMVSALIGDCPHCGARDAGNCRMPVCRWTN
jgi:hypothetical protein